MDVGDLLRDLDLVFRPYFHESFLVIRLAEDRKILPGWRDSGSSDLGYIWREGGNRSILGHDTGLDAGSLDLLLIIRSCRYDS